MKISKYWFASRLNLIYSIIIDLILFIIFFLYYQLFNEGNNIILLNLLFILFWLITSYVIGKYHKSDSNILSNFKQLFFSFVNFFILFCSTYFLFYKFLNFNFRSGLSENFFIFIQYILTSFFIQFSFNKFIFKNFILFQEWVVLGSNDFYSECLNLNKTRNLKLTLSTIEELSFKKNNINRNIIVENLVHFPIRAQEKLLKLNFSGSNIVSIIKWSEIIFQRIPLNFLSSDHLLDYFSNANSDRSFQIRLKRIADILLSILLIFLTIPLMIIFGLLIYLEDRGPILYFQERVGKKGVVFKICKLRSMHINAESKGAQWSRRKDSRITTIGGFLRSTRIDELPQLFSVLKGDMSLIGPRPERPEMDLMLEEKIPFYDLRYLVKPGLSGWAQVNYPYGSSVSDSEMKLTYDFFYIKNFSFWLDLLIFFKTLRLVFRREGSLPIR